MNHDLFSYKPPVAAFARAADPETSKAASRSIEPELANLEAVVLRAIPAAPSDVVLDEVVEATGLDKVTASPRFRPLEEKGLIVRTGKRPGYSGRKQTSWALAAGKSQNHKEISARELLEDYLKTAEIHDGQREQRGRA